jgi:transposase
MEKLPKKPKVVETTLVQPNAAGIDIGDSVHAVAVPIGRDVESARTFDAFTCDLEAIIAWLTKCRVETVALERAGVYWENYLTCWFNMDSRCIWLTPNTHVT